MVGKGCWVPYKNIWETFRGPYPRLLLVNWPILASLNMAFTVFSSYKGSSQSKGLPPLGVTGSGLGRRACLVWWYPMKLWQTTNVTSNMRVRISTSRCICQDSSISRSVQMRGTHAPVLPRWKHFPLWKKICIQYCGRRAGSHHTEYPQSVRSRSVVLIMASKPIPFSRSILSWWSSQLFRVW